MPFETRWLHEKRVVYAQIQGEVTLDDIRRYGEEVSARLDDGTAPVHVVLDCTAMQKFPVSLNAIMAGGRYATDPKHGIDVIIGGPRLLRSVAGMVSKMLNTSFRTADTLDAAVQVLLEADATLAGLADRSS